MSGQSLFCQKDVPASDCSKRQQQLRAHHCAAVAVGIYKNRRYVLFPSGEWGCETTYGKSALPLGNIGFSWALRIVTELPVYALPGIIPQLAVARCRLAWDALAFYILFLIALDIADGYKVGNGQFLCQFHSMHFGGEVCFLVHSDMFQVIWDGRLLVILRLSFGRSGCICLAQVCPGRVGPRGRMYVRQSACFL